MRQIRNNVFETNSSSIHSIAISKEPVAGFPNVIYFHLGEFGWKFEEVDPADYLYTAIMYMYDGKDKKEKLDKLKSILDSHNIEYEFERPNPDNDMCCMNGYIDHVEDLDDFINAVLSEEDMLMRLLFGNSHVFTGHDNSDAEEQAYIKRWNSAIKDYNYKTGKMIIEKNPYYMGVDDYDWFYKGN